MVNVNLIYFEGYLMRTETVVMSYEEFYNEMDRIGIPYAPNQKLWNIDENGTMIYLD